MDNFGDMVAAQRDFGASAQIGRVESPPALSGLCNIAEKLGVQIDELEFTVNRAIGSEPLSLAKGVPETADPNRCHTLHTLSSELQTLLQRLIRANERARQIA